MRIEKWTVSVEQNVIFLGGLFGTYYYNSYNKKKKKIGIGDHIIVRCVLR